VQTEPVIKRVTVFIDGQNLYHTAKLAFGYQYPNYDPARLAQQVAAMKGWQLQDVYFYTGVPDAKDKPFWNHFWNAKLAVMGTRGVRTFQRALRYHDQDVMLSDGTVATIRVGQEKGIDLRLALDVVRLSLERAFDVAIIFSQDQDLSELADEVRRIATQQNRWVKLACAFPASSTYTNRRGINKTDWIRIEKDTYDACIDPNDYRLKRVP
jgi:uncharacterized LabA/DUF88 family protein